MKNELIQKTFEELLNIDVEIGKMYQEDENLRESKFGYAVKRFYEKNIKPTVVKMQEELQDMYLDNALEDEKTKAVIYDEKSTRFYSFSKEGLKNVIKLEREIVQKYNKIVIDVEPYISTYKPELSEERKELLKGLLI